MPSIREKAMDYLSRREHSRVELKKKLLLKDFLPDEIDSALDKLAKDDLQSDDRFAQNYVRYRQQLGFGPKRIELELRARGISENLIEHYVDARNTEWKKQIKSLWRKKFSDTLKNQQQQFRFLLYRGYAAEDISQLLRNPK